MSTSWEDKTLQIVIFKIGKEEFAFNIANVKEIIRMADITKVPKSKEFIEGVINLRGNVIPIVDLRKRLNMNVNTSQNTNRIIVVEIDDITVGFIVDSVLETKEIQKVLIEPPLVVMGGIENDYISGIAKLENRLLSLLHIDKILALETKVETFSSNR